MGIERGALGSLLGHTGPDRRERALRGAGVRRAPLLLGAQRHLGLQPRHHVGLRRRRRDRALRPQLPQVHRAGAGAHRRDPGVPEPHAEPLRHHRPDPAGAARARRRSRRRSPRTRWRRTRRASGRCTPWSPTAPTTACATTPPTREARLAKSVDRIHFDEAWYGYARFNPMYRDRYAMRGEPGRSSDGRPDRLRHPLDPQAAGRALADLVHPHPRRPGRHRPRPLQRGLLLAGEHLAALRADRVERRGGRDDGRPGRRRRSPRT